MKPLRILSKTEFERLSHPEKLDYLTVLLEAFKGRRLPEEDTGGSLPGPPEAGVLGAE